MIRPSLLYFVDEGSLQSDFECHTLSHFISIMIILCSVATPGVFFQDLGVFTPTLGSWIFSEDLGSFLFFNILGIFYGF